MKKIIAIISCIAVLSAVCVLSAFAYDRIDDIPLETLEISEREERTEKYENVRSVDTILLNQLYQYNSQRGTISNGVNLDTNYTGHYKGQIYSSSVSGYDNVEVDFYRMTIAGNNIEIYYNLNNVNASYYIKNFDAEYTGEIIFTSIGDNTSANNFLMASLTIIDPMENVYDNSGDFLGFITDTLTDLVDYMVTNNLILIVMAIVIVSLGIGVLIRITKVK